MNCYRSTALYILLSFVIAFEISNHPVSAKYIQKPTDKPIKLTNTDIATANIIKKSNIFNT